MNTATTDVADEIIDDRSPNERPLTFPTILPVPDFSSEKSEYTGGFVLDDIGDIVTKTAMGNVQMYASSVKHQNVLTGFETVIQGLWNAPLGKVILIGSAAGIGWALISAFLPSTGKKPISVPASVNATTAAHLQLQVTQEAAATARFLQRNGVSAADAQRGENAAILEAGTKIRLASSVPSPQTINSSKPIFVVGSNPNHYATLQNLNVTGYLNSISRSQTRSAIEANAAAVHHLDVSQ